MVDKRIGSSLQSNAPPLDGRPIFLAALASMADTSGPPPANGNLPPTRRYWMCGKCSSHQKEMWQEYGAANNLDPGCIMPKELRDLTLAEQALISRVSAMVSYYYISTTSVGYHKNVANLVQRVEQVAWKLPRAPATCGIVKVRVKGANSSERDFKVRRAKVIEALLWLQANNPLYSDIEIDEDAVRALPENGDAGVPECDHAPGEEIDSDLESEVGVDQGPQEASRAEGRDNKPVFETESGLIHGVPIAHERTMLERHLRSALEPKESDAETSKHRKRETMHEDGDSEPEDDSPMQYPTREGVVDEFNSPGYIALAFPHLFPYGIGDITQERLGEAVPWKDYFRHLMRYCDSRGEYRFQSDMRFRYFAFNTIQRHRAMSISRAFVRLGGTFRHSICELD